MNKNKVMKLLKEEVMIDAYKYLIEYLSKSGLPQRNL